MGEPNWPTKRSDGTVSVAARFTISDPSDTESIRHTIEGWLAGKAELGIDIDRDLTKPPQVESTDQLHADIVFDGTATSRRWKDWLVELTREVTNATDAVVLDGFQDLVSGRFRPG
jgi:hypothetical protein